MSRYEAHSSPELLAAQSLYAEIDGRALEIEAAKRLPADLAARINQAGLYRMAIPRVYGGPERTLAQILRANEAVAYADGSVGWCSTIYNATGFMAALLAPEWAEEMYCGKQKMAISCGSFRPYGRAGFVKGGIKVSGRWQWGSGAHNADWIIGGALLMENGKPLQFENGEPRIYVAYFSRDQVKLIDNWDPAGLIGSGSGDFEVTDAFVPEGRWFVFGASKPQVDDPLHRLPFFGVLACAHTAAVLGIAQRAIDSFVELARGKVPAWQRDTLAKNPIAQTSFGRAEAQLHAARASIYEIVEEVTDCVTRGGEPTLEHRRRLRMASNFAADTAADVSGVMFRLAGGSSVHRTSPLQRCLKDIEVANQHGIVGDGHYRMAGKLKLLGERDIMMF